jgi:5-bromo-4-chloroindolyl phosphate hydrolysis protein
MKKNEIELSVLRALNTPSVGYSIGMNLGKKFMLNGKELTETEYTKYIRNTPDLKEIKLKLGIEI